MTMSFDPFANLYDADRHDRTYLGDQYIGPDRFEPGVETLIARFESEEDDDGQDVELYCIALPARFYKIKALPTPNSIGKEQLGFTLSTGSGDAMLKWAIETCEAIAEGMVGCDE